MRYVSTVIASAAMAACSLLSPTNPYELQPTTGVVAAQTTAPAPTSIASITSVPPSPTPTLAPTPLGGTDAFLTFVANDSQPGKGSFLIGTLDHTGDYVLLSGSSIAETFQLMDVSVSPLLAPDGSTLGLIVCRAGDCDPNTHRLLLFSQDLSHSADIPLPGFVQSAEWTLDGSKLLLAIHAGGSIGRRGYAIYVVGTSADSFGDISYLRNASAAFWAPDGQHFYYAYYGVDSPNFFLSLLDGSERRACEDCTMSSVSYLGRASPDGQTVVFSTESALLLANSDLSAATLIPTDYWSRDLAWSPDGKKLGLTDDSRSSPEIHSIRVEAPDGGESERYDVARPVLAFCGWSPDSRNLVYRSSNMDTLVLQPVDPRAPRVEVPFDIRAFGVHGVASCPVWLSPDAVSRLTRVEPPLPSWSFDLGLQEWRGADDIVGADASGGLLKAESIGYDPQLYSPEGLATDATRVSSVEIRMRVSAGTQGQLFFTTDSRPDWSEAKSRVFELTPGSSFETYVIQVWRVSDWRGTISQLRVDPTDHPATIEIDYIRLNGK